LPDLILQPEQPPRIIHSHLHPIVLADRAGIEPHRGVVDAPLDYYSVVCFDEMTRPTDTCFIIAHDPITMALSIAGENDP